MTQLNHKVITNYNVIVVIITTKLPSGRNATVQSGRPGGSEQKKFVWRTARSNFKSQGLFTQYDCAM